MGLCEFCGTQAGFLRRNHRACLRLFTEGVELVAGVMADDGMTTEESAQRIKNLAVHHRIVGDKLIVALENAWADCVKADLRQDGFTQDNEERLDALLGPFGLSDMKSKRRRLWLQVLGQRRKAAQGIIDGHVKEGMELALRDHSGATGTGRTVDQVHDDILPTAKFSNIEDLELKSLIVLSVEGEMEHYLEDGLLTHAEEHAVEELARRFDIQSDGLDEDSIWAKKNKFSALRDLTEGKLPVRFANMQVPFRLMKSEDLVWVFDSVDYGVIKTRREFRGGSTGVSVRIARGVYLRQGAFKGRQVEVEEPVHVDTGLLGITTKHIYFAGPSRSFRIRHSKIVSLTPYSDGLGLTRDTASAKPETFRVNDGWFLYNLLQNIEVV